MPNTLCTSAVRGGSEDVATTKQQRNIEFSISGAVCVSVSVCEVSPSEKEVGDRGKVPPGLPQVETSVSRRQEVVIHGRLIEKVVERRWGESAKIAVIKRRRKIEFRKSARIFSGFGEAGVAASLGRGCARPPAIPPSKPCFRGSKNGRK